MSPAASYLPSAHFSTIAGSIMLSGALILGAHYYTAPRSLSSLSAPPDTALYTSDEWQKTLEQVQTEAAISAPAAPDAEVESQLREAAKSGNLTDSVARTLFVSVSSAQQEGLGGDFPTQDKLIAEAAAQLQPGGGPKYAATDLRLGTQDKASLHLWGNGVMAALGAHTAASVNDTYVALGEATDNNDKSKLAPLRAIGAAYAAIGADIMALKVPPTLSPLQLKMSNTFAAIAATYPDLEKLGSDPLRALAALQNFKLYMEEESRLFTNVAQELSKNGILFTKDEPGSAWSVYVPSAQ